MSKPVNAFFNIRINGVRNGQTPTLLVSGVLHCVQQVSPDQYLPVAYYTDGATGSENSLNNVRVTADTFSFASGVLGPRLHIDTLAFTVTVTSGAIAYASKPADPIAFTEYDMTFTLLDVTATVAVPVPSYNEIDSDVVLTTASPTAWNRPQPTGSEIVIKSNVLTLIYSALYAKDSTNSLDNYVILGNTDDLATVPDTDVALTKVWQFKTPADGGHYDPVKDQFNFNKSGDTSNTLSCEAVDKILLGIAPDILQANDTLDITVNGIDSDTRNLYTTTLTYTGAPSASANGNLQYPKNLFAGLLEKNMAAYQSKQAICIAVSKYNLGKGLNTTENPPFSFSYKKSGLFKVLDEVILDFTKYYYIVYHFAQAGTFVRALRLFSKPTANADKLKDVIVLAGKHDAYVDLELATPPTSQFTNIGITYTYDISGNQVTGTIAHSSAGRGTFQLFILESDLYTARKISEPATGSRLRVYFGTNPLPGTTFKIVIAATNPTTACSFQGSISKRNILNLTSLPAAMTSFVELKKSNWDSYLSTISTIAAQAVAKNSFNYDISQWDLVGSGITSLSGWLQDFKAFDQHLGNWNTSNVTDMSNMFKGATSFNRPIDTWDTSNVKNMEGMFEGATGFNQSLVGWNVASVSSTTDTSGISTTLASSRGFTRMFKGASTFDGDISTWTSASKAGANQMFEGASSFDGPFSATAGQPFTVIACEAMFHGASAFNQDWVAQQIFADGCTSTKNTFKGAISLGSGKTWSPHTLPASCQTAESMFEGAYSLNRALDSSGNPSLTSMVSMYKGASAFNSPVSVSGLQASLLLCNSMFEKAVLMNSAVTLTNSFYAPAVSYIQMNRMFLDAVKFNKNVVFTPRRVVSAQQMFQGASSYGNDDNDQPKPTLGKAYGCEIVYGSPPDVSGVAMPFQYMFAGTRFDDLVTGTGPRDCSYMFAGATYFNTQLGINFMPTGTTTLEGMFQGASSLEVSPFYDGTLTVARTDNSGYVVTQPYLDFMKTVTSLKNLFKGATRFNPDITRWGTRLSSSSSRDYTSAFESATSFNQDLPSNWPVGVFTNMFANAISYAFDKTWTIPTTTEAPTTTVAPTTEAPTTEAQTTEAPTTTVAPTTTEAQTTEAQTTEAPTTTVAQL